MTAQELKETGQRLFKSRQYAEAVPLLKSAAELLPKDEIVWQELVLAASRSGQREQGIEFCKQAIKQHPRSGWLWRQLGGKLVSIDRLEEAEKALTNSKSLESNSPWLWRYLVQLRQKQKNFEGEILAWENLFDWNWLRPSRANLIQRQPSQIT
jgi:predicted Zn-dependent protease